MEFRILVRQLVQLFVGQAFDEADAFQDCVHFARAGGHRCAAVERGGQLTEPRRVEDGLDGQFHTGVLAQQVDQAGRQQRVAAESEEAARRVQPARVDPQQLGPDGHHRPLGVGEPSVRR